MWCLAPAKPTHCRIVSVSTRCHSPFDQPPRHLPVLSLLSWWIAHTSLQKSAVCHVTICIYPASCTRMPECFRVVVKKNPGDPLTYLPLSSHDDSARNTNHVAGPLLPLLPDFWMGLSLYKPGFPSSWITLLCEYICNMYICDYIQYVFIGAPQIVRIPGMIQLGSWEFCWKYQLKPIPCANSLVFVLYHRQ